MPGRRIAHERILGRLGPSSHAPRRSWRAGRDARTHHGLSGAARIDAAGGCLRRRARSACEPDGRSAARRVGEGHRPACRCRRARKLVLHDEFPRPADGGAVAGGGLCRAGPKGRRRPAADLSVAIVSPDPAQRARRLRRPLYIARSGAVLSQPTGGRSRRHAAAGRCGGDRGGAACPARPAFIAAHGHAATAEVLRRDGRDGRRKRLDLLVAIGRARDGR